MTPCEITREIKTRVRVADNLRKLADSRLAWQTAQIVAPHFKRGSSARLLKSYLKTLRVTEGPEIDEEEFAVMLAESRERAAQAQVSNGNGR